MRRRVQRAEVDEVLAEHDQKLDEAEGVTNVIEHQAQRRLESVRFLDRQVELLRHEWRSAGH